MVKDLCISCYNRAREAKVGKNRKGGQPLLVDRLHTVCVRVTEAGHTRSIEQAAVTSATEVMVAFAKTAKAPLLFAWGRGRES